MSLLLLDNTIIENINKTNNGGNILNCNSWKEVYFDIIEVDTYYGTFIKENLSGNITNPIISFNVSHNGQIFENVHFNLSCDKSSVINFNNLFGGKQVIVENKTLEQDIILLPEDSEDTFEPLQEVINDTSIQHNDIINLFAEETKKIENIIEQKIYYTIDSKINDAIKQILEQKEGIIKDIKKEKDIVLNESHGGILAEFELIREKISDEIETYIQKTLSEQTSTNLENTKGKIKDYYNVIVKSLKNNITTESHKVVTKLIKGLEDESERICEKLEDESQKITGKIDVLTTAKFNELSDSSNTLLKNVEEQTNKKIEDVDNHISSVIDQYKKTTSDKILANISELEQSLNEDLSDYKNEVNILINEKLSDKVIYKKLKNEITEKFVKVTDSKEFKKVLEDFKKDFIQESKDTIDQHVKSIYKRLQIYAESMGGGGGTGTGGKSGPSYIPIIGEELIGDIDGVNNIFTTSVSTIMTSTISVYINGLKQEKKYYTVTTPNIITLEDAPMVDDYITADYFVITQ